MLNGVFPSIVIIICFALIFGSKFLKRSITGLQFFYWVIVGLYVAGSVSVTLFPFPYQKFLIDTMIEDKLGLPNNYIPFKGIKEAIQTGYSPVIIKQIGGNILLFIPLGFALPILFSNIKKKKVMIVSFLVSLTIETTQLIAGKLIGYNYRAFDIDDLMMNTLGAFIGLIIFKLLFTFLKKNNLLINQKSA
ncbi:VanZ family protein [Fictibacillus sp. NRS-1165]|uniref:VanZ family protein n=1 Tax=Fictibacillus sp. NRS-1165 TaxID=3144463 RepID=UPI003D20FF39